LELLKVVFCLFNVTTFDFKMKRQTKQKVLVLIYISFFLHLVLLVAQSFGESLLLPSMNNMLYSIICLVCLGINCYPDFITKSYFSLVMKIIFGVLLSFGLGMMVYGIPVAVVFFIFYFLVTFFSFYDLIYGHSV